MKIAIWFMVAVMAAAVIGGAVYLGTHDFNRSNPREPSRGGAQIKNPETGSGKQTFRLEVDGANREFIVYRPDDISESEEVPVVFMYHGSGGSGDKMYKETGWKAQADEGGFMVVYPTGMRYHVFNDEIVQQGEVNTDVKLFTTKWESYSLPGLLDEDFPDQTLHDDVKFTREMVDFLNENYAVDQDRYYASGFSNGAEFTMRLAVEMSDVFAAYAPTGAGVIPDEILAKLDELGQHPESRPVMQMIGSKDPKLTHAAGVEEFSIDESAASEGNPINDKYIANYLTLENLANEYTYELKGGNGHFTYDQSLSGDDNVYHMVIVNNMGHIYPNGTNFRFDAADVFWPFFEEYSL